MNLSFPNKKSLEEIDKIIDEKRKTAYKYNVESDKGIYILNENFEAMVNLLSEYENKIDLVYIDPPFNTNSTFYYNSERTATISNSKNNAVAYSDKMSFDEYLEFIRERVVLIHKLLSDKGTLYFHIDDKVGHYVKIILDEVFGIDNFVNDITRLKSNPKNFKRKAFGNQKDVIYIYSKKVKRNIFNDVKLSLSDKDIIRLFPKIDNDGNRYTTVPCHAPGETKNGVTGQKWREMYPPEGRHWRSSPDELEKLDSEGLIEWSKNGVPRIIKFADAHKGKKIQDVWDTYKDSQYPIYPTEKNIDMLEMIVEQSSLENSIIMDCFCGSGSFLLAGVRKKRFVIGIDNSEISYKVVKERKELANIQFIK